MNNLRYLVHSKQNSLVVFFGWIRYNGCMVDMELSVNINDEGRWVKFYPPRWGETVAQIVQVNKDVLLRTSHGSFIREISEIIEIIPYDA